MNWSFVVQLVLTAASVIGVAATVTIILRTASAEREWRRAAGRMSDKHMRLIEDILEERAGVLRAARLHALERRYLADALEETIQLLRDQHQIPQEAAERIARALRQPSETGRQLYADKLAREAIKARGAAESRRHLVGA